MLKFILLLTLWLVLSEHFEPFFIACGFCSSLTATLLPYYLSRGMHKEKPILSHKLFSYFPWLFYQLILANIDLVLKIWQTNLSLTPTLKMIKIPECASDRHIALLANSITLTPGTVSVEVSSNPYSICVHALDKASLPGVKEMRKKLTISKNKNT